MDENSRVHRFLFIRIAGTCYLASVIAIWILGKTIDLIQVLCFARGTKTEHGVIIRRILIKRKPCTRDNHQFVWLY